MVCTEFELWTTGEGPASTRCQRDIQRSISPRSGLLAVMLCFVIVLYNVNFLDWWILYLIKHCMWSAVIM